MTQKLVLRPTSNTYSIVAMVPGDPLSHESAALESELQPETVCEVRSWIRNIHNDTEISRSKCELLWRLT